MRSSVTVLLGLGLVACGKAPARQTEFPTFSPDTYHVRISNLRTTLARGGIGLRVAGVEATFATADCDGTSTAIIAGCARCDLASERTPVAGAVIEAATASFRRYPADVLAATGVEQVAFCTDIVHAKESAIERPAGLADLRGKQLLLSVKTFLGAATYRSGAEWTVDDIAHHEVFHHLEYARMRGDMVDDPEWNLHNPLGFSYDATNKAEERRAGFVNAYAMTDATEDKASVFEMIMAHADDLCALARTDETIRIKTRIIWWRVWKAVGTDSFMRAAAPCVSRLVEAEGVLDR